jgi:hypothetical protein
MNQGLLDKIFRDDEGNVVIAQTPNPPLWAWLAATILKLIPSNAYILSVLDSIAFGALFTWAWLELFSGVNYLRRAMGLIVIGILIVSKIPQA